MSNHDHLVHVPDTDVANLDKILAVIQLELNRSAKDPLLRFEADLVLAHIGLVLGFVPVKHPGPFAANVCSFSAVEFNRLSQT